MTNFEITVEIDLACYDQQAGLLSVMGTMDFVKHTGPHRVLTEFERVSSMPDCFISVEQGSPSLAIACRESNSELVRLYLGSGKRNSSSPFHHPGCCFWSIRRWNFNDKSIVAKKLCDESSDNWSNHCSSWNCSFGSGIWV